MEITDARLKTGVELLAVDVLHRGLLLAEFELVEGAIVTNCCLYKPRTEYGCVSWNVSKK